MRALDKKLFREFWAMRMQSLAIILVIAGGVSIFIMSLSTLHSLLETQQHYYRTHQFAHIFANLKRAPNTLIERLENIPGVAKVDTRTTAYINVDVPDFDEGITAHIISLPANSAGRLNSLYLTSGRLLEGGDNNQVIVSKEFASAHKLKQGSQFAVTINGRKKSVTVVGTAQSPEYIYQIAPGALFPDLQRYGVMWMLEKPLATAFDMDGAFNTVAIKTDNNVHVDTVIDQLDELLKPYGGIGAYARKDQLSNRFLSEELRQQRTIATVFPIIFFGVASFLLNIVINRLISLQREQIGSLKAFGYSKHAIALHYIKLILLIVAMGVIVGIGLGIWMGTGMANLYMTFYSLPYMQYILKPIVPLSATGICLLVAVGGTLMAVNRAVRLTPAEAMRPAPPSTYRISAIERMGMQRWLSQPSRMVLRNIIRQPLRAILTIIGIAMACGTMVIGGFQQGAIEQMVYIQFSLSQREDMMLTFVEPTSQRVLYSIKSLPGITHAEGFRSVPIQLHAEHRHYQTSIQSYDPNGNLLQLLDQSLNPIDLPEKGLVVSYYLAQLLQIKAGDWVTVEVLENNRPVFRVPVTATAKQFLGVNVYMRREALNQLLTEGYALSGALLQVDSTQLGALERELKEIPQVAGSVKRTASITAFNDTLAETIVFFTLITTLLGASIAFGVVYNCMRITLSERSKELASMRVLGFTQGEVASILFGELSVLTLLAIPPGLLFGYGLCAFLAQSFASDLYRIALHITPDVYAFAASVILASALMSGILIWRNVQQLDMVAVLKTKE